MQSFLLLALTTWLPAALADCNSFEPITQPGQTNVTFTTTSTPSTYRISAIANCSEGGVNTNFPSDLFNSCNSTQCALGVQSDFHLRLNRTLNNPTGAGTANTIYNTTSDVEASLFDLARPLFENQDGINFNTSSVYNINNGGTQTCLDEGEAGYWVFSPIYHCVDGTLSGCDGDNYPADETVLRFCAPGVSRGALSGLDLVVPDGIKTVVRCGGCDDTVAPPNATQTIVDSGNTTAAVSLGVALWNSASTTLLGAITWGWIVLVTI